MAAGCSCHLSSHARTSRSATSDTAKASQANHGRQPEQRVSSPPVGTISSASDVADNRNQNSKPARSRPAVPTPVLGLSLLCQEIDGDGGVPWPWWGGW